MARKYMTKKQIKDYEYLCHERIYGRLLTSDGIRLICEANEYDAGKNWTAFLKFIAKDFRKTKIWRRTIMKNL